jgi:hypothetical protein
MKAVPTVAELYAMGRHLAYPATYTADGKPSTWRITDEGHALIGAAMSENALEARANGSADWVQPPSSGQLPVQLLIEGQ